MPIQYSVSGELWSGCIHSSPPISRRRARQLLKHVEGLFWRSTGYRKFAVAGQSAKELPGGYRYKQLYVSVQYI